MFEWNIFDIGLDEEQVRVRAMFEARLIKTNKKDSYRSFDGDILPNTMKGHYGEWIAMTQLGHTDNPEEYHDTFDQDGVPTEHKVSYSRYKLDQRVDEYLWRIMEQERRNWPPIQLDHRVYGWIGDALSGKHKLHGIYEYDEKMKKMVYIKPEVWYNSNYKLRNTQ